MFVPAADTPVLDVDTGISRLVLAHGPQFMLVHAVFKKDYFGGLS